MRNKQDAEIKKQRDDIISEANATMPGLESIIEETADEWGAGYRRPQELKFSNTKDYQVAFVLWIEGSYRNPNIYTTNTGWRESPELRVYYAPRTGGSIINPHGFSQDSNNASWGFREIYFRTSLDSNIIEYGLKQGHTGIVMMDVDLDQWAKRIVKRR